MSESQLFKLWKDDATLRYMGEVLVPFKCIAWLLHIVSMRVVLRGGEEALE